VRARISMAKVGLAFLGVSLCVVGVGAAHRQRFTGPRTQTAAPGSSPLAPVVTRAWKVTKGAEAGLPSDGRPTGGGLAFTQLPPDLTTRSGSRIQTEVTRSASLAEPSTRLLHPTALTSSLSTVPAATGPLPTIAEAARPSVLTSSRDEDAHYRLPTIAWRFWR
jgi:hypothetical protein